jgi:hypothetical protein
MIRGQPQQKVIKTPSQPMSQEWWFMPVIPSYLGGIGRRISAQVWLPGAVEGREQLKTPSEK